MDTQGIKYAGSKREIIPVLLQVIKYTGAKTVLDGFSGTTRVSQALKKSGYIVHSNDIAVWSKVFGQCYLLNKKSPDYYKPIIDHLNSLKPKHGWFSKYYGGEDNNGSSVQEDGKKRLWQMHNTRKLDAIREEIDKISKNKIEKAVLLTSLLLAMDKVDSSVGHQVSYLKNWAKRSYLTMKMEVPQLIIDKNSHKVYQKDIFDLIKDIEVDVAYFDPPYGSSNELMPPSRVRYASYYHLWKTICLNDKPKVIGAANRREDVSDVISGSKFEDFRKNEKGEYVVMETIENLIKHTKAKYVILSYNNNGRATLEAILEILSRLNAKSSILEMDYRKHVMAGMAWTNEWKNNGRPEIKSNREYLFIIDKSGKNKSVFNFTSQKILKTDSLFLDQQKILI